VRRIPKISKLGSQQKREFQSIRKLRKLSSLISRGERGSLLEISTEKETKKNREKTPEKENYSKEECSKGRFAFRVQTRRREEIGGSL